MEISERRVGGVTVIDLKNNTNVRGEYDGFQKVIRERLAAGQFQFVINLAGCQWIDSSGLGEVIKSFVHVMRQGGNLKLTNVPQKIKDILSVTNLTQVFEIYDNEATAIKSFS